MFFCAKKRKILVEYPQKMPPGVFCGEFMAEKAPCVLVEGLAKGCGRV